MLHKQVSVINHGIEERIPCFYIKTVLHLCITEAANEDGLTSKENFILQNK